MHSAGYGVSHCEREKGDLGSRSGELNLTKSQRHEDTFRRLPHLFVSLCLRGPKPIEIGSIKTSLFLEKTCFWGPRFPADYLGYFFSPPGGLRPRHSSLAAELFIAYCTSCVAAEAEGHEVIVA